MKRLKHPLASSVPSHVTNVTGARFRFERDRQRFIAAHGVLRDLLGRYLETQPGGIRYVYNAFGKPVFGGLKCEGG